MVLVPLGGTPPKPRLAVVLDDEVDGVVGLIAVTGTDRPLDRVVVRAGSRQAKALGGIYKDSFFYAANIAAVPARMCTVQRGQCPPNLYEELLDLRRRSVVHY